MVSALEWRALGLELSSQWQLAPWLCKALLSLLAALCEECRGRGWRGASALGACTALAEDRSYLWVKRLTTTPDFSSKVSKTLFQPLQALLS